MVQLEGSGELKNPMIPSGIERATFRLVAQCLNQLRYRVPPLESGGRQKFNRNNILGCYSALISAYSCPILFSTVPILNIDL
jgi:hypothetical protein